MPLGNLARAGDVYQCSVLEESSNASDFHLLKAGKLKISTAPASKPGTGLAMQLILANVDCVAEGNDLGKPNKCGVAAHGPSPAAPVSAVVGLSVHIGGVDLANVFGIPIQFSKGTATFVGTGKNKIDGSAFGALIMSVLGQKMGFNTTSIRLPGSVPADCGNVPIAGPGCLDGTAFAFTGLTLGL